MESRRRKRYRQFVAERDAGRTGQLTVNAVNAVEQKYYGALLPVNPDVKYKNFTFELTFKVNKSNGDLHRRIGIIYRTRYKSSSAPVTGYIMNYRLNGRNAYSAVNAGKSFHDIGEISPGGSLADGTTALVDLGLAVGLPIGIIIVTAAIGIGIFFIVRKNRKA